jgi:PiT family inorganic phosphate transporter
VEIIAEFGPQFLGLACIAGFFMAWGIGANDVANAMGTSVGSRALTIRQAILIAMLFEFLGAYLAGGEVTATIRKGIIDPELLADDPQLLVYGMMSALFAAGTWLMIASVRGWPVSTTHSIVGAIVGFAAVGISADAVSWGQVGAIAASWVVSPLLAGSISFGLFMSVKALILDTDDPFARAKRFIPFYMWIVGFMIAMVTVLKGLKHLGFSIDFGLGSRFLNALPLAALVGLLVAIGGALLLRGIREVPNEDDRFASVERVFAVLMVFTACSMAFAHGSNDVANAVGPLAAIASIVQSRRPGLRHGGHARLDPAHRCPGYRRGPCHLRLEGHRHRRSQDHRADAVARFRRRTRRRLDGGDRLGDGPAGLHHAHAGRRGTRCRPGARHRRHRPARDRFDFPQLGDHAARRRRAVDYLLLHAARHLWLTP